MKKSLVLMAAFAVGLSIAASSPMGATAEKNPQVDANGSPAVELSARRLRSCRGCGSTSLERIVQPLKAKIEQIVAECGSRVISTDNRGGVTPNHRNHRAVDVSGNPKCIYDHLRDWPGGVSTDYATAPETPHVHVSYCPPGARECGARGREWGRRFAHNHERHYAARERGTRIRLAGILVQRGPDRLTAAY